MPMKKGHTLSGVYSQTIPRSQVKQSKSMNIVHTQRTEKITNIVPTTGRDMLLDPLGYRGRKAHAEIAAEREIREKLKGKGR